MISHLSGVMVSMPAIGPKIHGLKLGQGDGFLGRKNLQQAFFQRGSEAINQPHDIRFYGM
jgi:hypothetical protein